MFTNSKFEWHLIKNAITITYTYLSILSPIVNTRFEYESTLTS